MLCWTVDTARREVILEDKRLSFDYLVVATGSRHAYTDDTWEIVRTRP